MRKVTGPELSRAVGAKDRGCFRNAWDAVFLVPGGRYVEGYAVGPDVPLVLAHGWVEAPGGKVVEVTPVWQKEGIRYFPARRWTAKKALAAAEKSRLLPLDPHFAAGAVPPRYRAAYNAANRLVLRRWFAGQEGA